MTTSSLQPKNAKLKDAYVSLVTTAQDMLIRSQGADIAETFAALVRSGTYSDFARELKQDIVIGPKLGKAITADGFPSSSLSDTQIAAAVLSHVQFFREAMASNPDDVYRQFEDAFHTEQVTVRANAPIHFLTPTFDEMQLDASVRIRRLIIPESDLFLIRTIWAKPFGDLTPSLLFDATWKLRIRFPSNMLAVDWRIPTVGTISLTKLVFYLRLLGFWAFDIPSLVVYPLALGVPLGFQSFFHQPSPLRRAQLLERKDAFELQQFWRLTGKFFGDEMPSWLHTALNRVNMACLREDPRDGLLDLVIALEALLQCEGGLEIGYRLRKRGGTIMGLGEPKSRLPETVAFAESTIKRAYKIRSAIVHGERRNHSGEEIEALNLALFDLIRSLSIKLTGLGIIGVQQKNLLEDFIDESMTSPPMRNVLEKRLCDSGLLDFLGDRAK